MKRPVLEWIAAALFPAALGFAPAVLAKEAYCAYLTAEDFRAAELARITGKHDYTSLGVKRGKVVFHVGVPTTQRSEEAVLALARLVLQRTDNLGR